MVFLGAKLEFVLQLASDGHQKLVVAKAPLDGDLMPVFEPSEAMVLVFEPTAVVAELLERFEVVGLGEVALHQGMGNALVVPYVAA